MQTNLDYLIIGGGLAGSILGWRLQQQGATILIVDNNPAVSASRTAAGLINPITGKRLVKSVDFERWHREALTLYRELEHKFGQELYFEMPLLRLFRTEDGAQMLERRRQDESYHPYIGQTIEPGSRPFNAPFGGFEVNQAGYLETTRLLDTLHHSFMESGALEYGLFEYSDLQLVDGGVQWHQYRSARVIFCEGYQMGANPWFGELPLQVARGEILSVKIDGLELKQVVNGGHWLIPRQDGSYRLGATHSWQGVAEPISQDARRELLQGFNEIIAGDYLPRVVAQQAGVRPATKDHQPFMGLHHQHPQLAIFNGFGAKGALLIPWHARQFVQHLAGMGTLPAEADIKRFG